MASESKYRKLPQLCGDIFLVRSYASTVDISALDEMDIDIDMVLPTSRVPVPMGINMAAVGTFLAYSDEQIKKGVLIFYEGDPPSFIIDLSFEEWCGYYIEWKNKFTMNPRFN